MGVTELHSNTCNIDAFGSEIETSSDQAAHEQEHGQKYKGNINASRALSAKDEDLECDHKVSYRNNVQEATRSVRAHFNGRMPPDWDDRSPAEVNFDEALGFVALMLHSHEEVHKTGEDANERTSEINPSLGAPLTVRCDAGTYRAPFLRSQPTRKCPPTISGGGSV